MQCTRNTTFMISGSVKTWRSLPFCKLHPSVIVLESESDSGDEKAIAAMGILNTLETIVNVMEDQKEVGDLDYRSTLADLGKPMCRTHQYIGLAG